VHRCCRLLTTNEKLAEGDKKNIVEIH